MTLIVVCPAVNYLQALSQVWIVLGTVTNPLWHPFLVWFFEQTPWNFVFGDHLQVTIKRQPILKYFSTREPHLRESI